MGNGEWVMGYWDKKTKTQKDKGDKEDKEDRGKF